jgi:hypothetical protein
MDKTNVQQTSGNFTETCTFRRDFKTIWSQIPMTDDQTYSYTVGYKIYRSIDYA